MKSLVFKSAWILVKEMGITLSSALVISWAERKVEKMQNDIDLLNAQAFRYQEVKAIESLQILLIKKIKQIKPCYLFTGNINNDGARHYYGIGVYNGD